MNMMKGFRRVIGAKHKTEHPRRGGERLNRRRVAGFTMAELLIVVAILIVLMGVTFVAVQSHQKSVTQLQYDTIAKEIFVAAQNHLTLAKSENYRQIADLDSVPDTFYGNPDGSENDVYYFVSGDPNNANTALDQILPFGAVELVSGGQYILRYQPKAAKVLDVFYWTNGSGRFDANIGAGDYSTLVGTYRDEAEHKKYPNGLLGWCGGEGVVSTGTFLEAPIIEVKNEELLVVYVTDTNTSTDKASLEPQLKLILEGQQSGVKMAIPIKIMAGSNRVKTASDGRLMVILDDITTDGMHFADLSGSGFQSQAGDKGYTDFIPGENITIQAVAYSNKELTSVNYSGEWTTNSLFGEVTETEAGVADEVHINNIRHLENLNYDVSSVAHGGTYFNKKIDAVQTADLDWNTFKTRANTLKGSSSTDAAINIFDQAQQKTKDNCFLPVSATEYTLNYNGQNQVASSDASDETAAPVVENHKIKNIVVDSDVGGVFGNLTGATIENLELIDFDITSSGNAGALAGSITGATSGVTNVVAYNTPEFDATKAKAPTVTSTDGSVGGLIGSMKDTTVEKCAAALVVSGKDNAGGLVGRSDGGSVIGCYAGGHAVEKKDGDNVIGVWYGDVNEAGNAYNVTATGTATGNAGGLIGAMTGDSKVANCYSTCSVKGATAGGFVGKGSSGSLSNSYATGLVAGASSSSKIGAFAGELTARATDCLYFEIVNEIVDETTGMISYLPPVPGSETTTGIAALDESAKTYNDFTGADGAWTDAEAYDATLAQYYTVGDGLKYNLKSIPRLAGDAYTASGEGMPADFVATHYGDWPAPEIFVINEKSGS